MKTYVSCYSKPLSEMAIPITDQKHNTYGRKEIDAWLYQLRRTFPLSANDFHIKEHFQDEGCKKLKFWEVVLEYEERFEDDLETRERAFAVVDELPYEWDYEAKIFLGHEYFNYIMRLKCPQDFQEPVNPFDQAQTTQQ